jgi:hypothetical protein
VDYRTTGGGRGTCLPSRRNLPNHSDAGDLRAGTGQATEGWAVYRFFAGIVVAAIVPALAQGQSARLVDPDSQRTTSGASPDPFQDSPRPPAARLGVISGAKIGDVPDNSSDEERYNWGAPRTRRATPVSRTRDKDNSDDPDREDAPAGRGARLRDPAPGRLTHGNRGPASADDPGPPPVPAPGNGPTWWPNREQDLNDLRGQLPSFGEDRDRLAFQSDCAFDNFISPITNPFLAEDPRSLTELRPLYIYQTIPSGQYYYQGGNIQFFGTQARVALTDRFSIVLHKLGIININPDSPLANGGSGLAEIWLSPKFVFWRVPETQTLASFGMQFQLPVGGSNAFQDTGSFAILPYLSFARRMGEIDYGTFHLMNTAGYHIGTDRQRSDYFFDTIHLDLDVNNQHRFYPTLEMSWFHYTTNGQARPFLFFEGGDLANVGGTAAGHNILTIAPGFRYKFNDYISMGIAAEWTLGGNSDLSRFRLGIDMIWRY